jgi:hypothetical protein
MAVTKASVSADSVGGGGKAFSVSALFGRRTENFPCFIASGVPTGGSLPSAINESRYTSRNCEPVIPP